MANPNSGDIPKTVTGAFVQLNEDAIVKALLPNIVPFQYNPEKIDWSQTPWSGANDTESPTPGGQAQPFDLPKKFSGFVIMLDSTSDAALGIDGLGMGSFPRLAALEKLTEASQGGLGDFVQSAKDLLGKGSNSAPVIPKRAPILLVLGRYFMAPIKINSFAVSETVHGALYYPQRIQITLELETIIPHYCGAKRSVAEKIVEGAYKMTKAQNDAASLVGQAYGLTDAANIVLPL